MSKKPPTAVAPPRKLRCAVYTRKSSEEGLEMEFNSLDAQREACEAYVASQRAEGWLLVADRYDDGGFSGGTLERPALKRMRADIEAGKIDVVVVYKIDRLSRSLMDFSRLVEVFDQHKVTFVSVTQSFNTTTSMGRLTLNVLLSFAQFEREVIGERIRDKVAASRKKGIWMGGWAPLGYQVRDRKLVVNEVDAKLVRSIFQRFVRTGSVTTLARELITQNVRNKYDKLIDKGILYKMLNNPVYIGVAVHNGVSYPGEHVGIIDRKIWEKVQAKFQESPRKRAAATRAQTPSLLKGIIFGPTGVAMSPTHTRKNGRLYRYYLSQTVLKQGSDDCPVTRVPAAEIEKIVVDQVRVLLLSPEIIVQTWRSARKSIKGLTESEVRSSKDGRTATVSVPVTFLQRGRRKQILTPPGEAPWSPAPRVDTALVKAIVRAHRWRQMLEGGEYNTSAELAKAEQVNDSYVSRILRLTLLSPDIVDAIVTGQQPSTLQIDDLLRPLPSLWQQQKSILGWAR